MPEPITDDHLREIREALGDQVPAIWMHRNAWAWLAALCDEVERLRRESDHEREITDKAIARAEKAEAAVERVRRLATLALYKGPEPADTHAVVLDSLAKELLAALDGE